MAYPKSFGDFTKCLHTKLTRTSPETCELTNHRAAGIRKQSPMRERNQLERNVPCGAAAVPMVRVGGADRLRGAVTLMTRIIPV